MTLKKLRIRERVMKQWVVLGALLFSTAVLADDVKQKETIARGIANQIYREIQAAGKNKVSQNWLVNAIHVCIKADKSVVDDITALTIETLAGNTSGAVLRKTADGYERTVPMA